MAPRYLNSPAWWAVGFPMAALRNSALVYTGPGGKHGLEWIAIVLLCLLTVSVAVLATGRMLIA